MGRILFCFPLFEVVKAEADVTCCVSETEMQSDS